MKYLLDTNTCVEQLRRRASRPLLVRLAASDPGDIALCSVVVAELLYGAERSARRVQNLARVKQFCS